ncbi:MAG: hypothetical protein U0165_15800 [Polyangiaceae bacterium]
MFTIVECTDKKLVVKPKSVKYTYRAGGVAEIAYSGTSRPKAPASPPAPAAPSAAPSASGSGGAAPPPAVPAKGGCGACVIGREDDADSGTSRAFLMAAAMVVAGGVAYSARRRGR